MSLLEGYYQDIMEVVLHTPVQQVLAQYIARAPSDQTKLWIGTNFKNWLIKSPENLYKLPYLPRNATEQQKKAFQFNDLYDLRMSPDTATKLDHILDYFTANPNIPRLERMSVDNVLQAADLAVKQYNARVAKENKKAEPAKNLKTIMEFPNGFKIVEMLTQNALDREGAAMVHCVGTHHGCYLLDKSRRMFSLRDPQNQPHATIEVFSDGLRTTEIKGKKNEAPVRKYWPMLMQFVKEYGIVVDNDHRHIGLLKFTDPESREQVTMTQDEFKDMIQNPDDPRGQALIQNAKQNQGYSRYRYEDEDISLGMFNALYGSDDLTDEMVLNIFRSNPSGAMNVIEHNGNRLSFDQTKAVIQELSKRSRESNALNDLVRITKFTPEQAESIIAGLTEEQEILNKSSPHQTERWKIPKVVDPFVIALFKNQPSVYAGMILNDEEAIKRELDSASNRAAGPFFAFIALGKQPTPPMVAAAFYAQRDTALARIVKGQFKPTDEDKYVAMVASGSSYYSRDGEKEACKELLDVLQPDAEVIKKVFSPEALSYTPEQTYQITSAFSKALFEAIQEKAPQLLDKDTAEAAMIQIDEPSVVEAYLKNQDVVSPNLTNMILNKIMAKNEVKVGDPNNPTTREDWDDATRRKWAPVLGAMKQIPEEIVQGTLPLLRHDPVQPHEYSTSFKTNPLKGQPGQPDSIRIVKRSEKSPETIQRELQHERYNAANRYLTVVKAMIADHKPVKVTNRFGFENDSTEEAIDFDSSKLKQLRTDFVKMGKAPLFQTIMSRLENDHRRESVTGSSGDDWRRDAGRVNRFHKVLDKLRPIDIVKLMRKHRNDELFSEVINQAPERIPDIINASLRLKDRGYSAPGPGFGDKLEAKNLNKEKTFQALEAVWTDDQVPDGVKDKFTVAVFKRFKPGKNQLEDMVDRADSSQAAEYALKKTKKPSPKLVQIVADKYPEHLDMIGIDFIPDNVLKFVFEKLKWRVLADRDLRGYRVPDEDRRRKWGVSAKFHDKIDRTSPVFEKYLKAAKAAGKEKDFLTYARGSELEDQHDSLMTHGRDGDGNDARNRVDFDLLNQHIHDWTMRTLIKVGEHLNYASVEDKTKFLKILLDNFSAKKVARLVSHNGFLIRSHWNDHSPVRINIDQLSTSKLTDLVNTLLNQDRSGGYQDHGESFIKILVNNGFELTDDMRIRLLERGQSYGDIPNWIKTDGDISDRVKDWIAENQPLRIDHIRVPTQKMVDVLFKKFKLKKETERGSQDDGVPRKVWYKPTNHEEAAVGAWLGIDSTYGSDNELADPDIVEMVRQAARSRGKFALEYVDRLIKVLQTYPNEMYKHMPTFTPEEVKQLGVSEDDLSGRY